MQQQSFIIKACDFVTRYGVFALIFLLPVFFLPWTTDVLDFNKQSLLLVLAMLAVFASVLKILITGKFKWNKSLIHIAVGILFLAYSVSTIFSVYGYGSFWGQAQQSSASMATLVCLVLLYFLVSNIFSKKDIFKSAIILCFSAIIAETLGIFQLFGLYIFPFGFAKSAAFNTIGSAGAMAFFAAILLPVAMAMLIGVKKWWRYFFALLVVLSALVLVLVNYTMVWWVVLISSAVMLLYGTIRKGIFDGRWMALPMFFFVFALFFVILSPQVNLFQQMTSEVFLSQKTSLGITMQALKENPVFGSGPGTFSYDFLKFKNPEFSNSSIWNIVFNRPTSKILDILATTGVFGFLAFLALLALPIIFSIKFFILRRGSNMAGADSDSPEENYTALFLGISSAIAGQSVAWFIYGSLIAIDFVFFLFLAAIVCLMSKDRMEYALKPSSLFTLAITFVSTLIFIFGAGLLLLNGQRYFAEVNYKRGVDEYQANNKEAGLKNFEAAAGMNSSSDFYFGQLSQAYLLALNDISEVKFESEDDKKSAIEVLVSNAINSAKIATDINSKGAVNWSSRGFVYQSLLGISADSSKWAISSYEEALKLDPNNPYLFAQQGNVYLADALSPSAGDKKNDLLNQAKEKLEKSISLNQNYSNGLYSLGIVYDALKQKDKAIETFTLLQQLNPQNKEISDTLANLKAGKSIIQTATPPVESPQAPEVKEDNAPAG